MKIFVVVAVVVLFFKNADGIFLVIPEDVVAGFAAIYGFAPRIFSANDHRLGFGFRFGNHADLQVLYELGPQTVTQPLPPTLNVRTARIRERVYRRKPLLEFLLRTGVKTLKLIVRMMKRQIYDVDVYTDAVSNADAWLQRPA